MNSPQLWIGILLVGLGGGVVVAIMGLAAYMLFFSAGAASAQPETAKMVFNSTLPLLGTWVGAVVSYYFGKANFEAAAVHSQALIDRLGSANDDKLSQITVQQAMVPASRLITAFASDDSVDVLNKLNQASLDRLPVLQDGTKTPFALLDRGDLQGHTGPVQDVVAGKPNSQKAFKLLDVNSTLRDAINLLNQPFDPKATAIFVTQTGATGEDLLGMLVAKDLNRFI